MASEWMVQSQETGIPPVGSSSALLDSVASGSSLLPVEKAEESNLDGKESSPITSAELAHLQKKLGELEQVAKTRDERIKTVRPTNYYLPLPKNPNSSSHNFTSPF
jgi:hypothetical protein